MWSGLTWNSLASVGSATLTIVMPMIVMNIARTKTTLIVILGFRRRAVALRLGQELVERAHGVIGCDAQA